MDGLAVDQRGAAATSWLEDLEIVDQF